MGTFYDTILRNVTTHLLNRFYYVRDQQPTNPTIGLWKFSVWWMLSNRFQRAFAVSDIGRGFERLPKLSAALKDAFRFMTTWDFSRPEGLNAMSISASCARTIIPILPSACGQTGGVYGNLHQYSKELDTERLEALIAIRENVLKPVEAFAYYLNDWTTSMKNALKKASGRTAIC